MGAMCRYIEIMGHSTPSFMKDSWKHFLMEAPDKKGIA